MMHPGSMPAILITFHLAYLCAGGLLPDAPRGSITGERDAKQGPGPKGLPKMAPLSEEEAAQRLKNWEAAMAAHQAVVDANVSVASSCSSDIRAGMVGCHQFGTDWCWATGATGVGHFFAPKNYSCSGVECQVVGHKKNPSDPEACCRDKESCDKDTGTLEDIVDGIQWLLQTSEKEYQIASKPLSQEQLDKAVYMGNPVLFEISWYDASGRRTGGHIVWAGGCSGAGSYYIHDPESAEGDWQTKSYSDMLTYEGGKWTGTVYLDPRYSFCSASHSKGCGDRDTRGPTTGRVCSNCGCNPCDSDHFCYACLGEDGTCYTYDCGSYCSHSACSPLVKGYPKAKPALEELVI